MVNKNWALIKEGVVVNIVIASDEDAKDPQYLWVDLSSLDPSIGIGWLYDGVNFTNPNPPVEDVNG